MVRVATADDLEIVATLRYKMFKDIGTTNYLIENFIDETIYFYQKAYETGGCIHLLTN